MADKNCGEPYVGNSGPVKIGKSIVAPTKNTSGRAVSKSPAYKK